LDEFLLNHYVLLNNGVAFVAAIVGAIYLSKFKDSEVRYFIYFLWYVAIVQFLGSYTSFVENFDFLKPLKQLIEGTVFEDKYWIFTIFWTLGSALFYSIYFQFVLKNIIHKRIIKIWTYIFLVFSIIYIIIKAEELFSQMMPFIKIFGAFIILLCAIFYFIQILKSDELLTFYKSMNFYISSVIFIWWLVTTPVTFYQVYYSAADWSFVFLRWQIFLFMNLFMYLSFTFALFYCKPNHD